MSSFVLYEAFVIGFKEGFKVGIVWLVFCSYLIIKDRSHPSPHRARLAEEGAEGGGYISLLKPFYAGLLCTSFVSVLAIFIPHSGMAKEYLGNGISMSFALLFILSVAALFHASGVNLLGPLHPRAPGRPVLAAVVFLSTVLFFSTDSIGSILFLRELSFMKESLLLPYTSAALGFGIAVLLFLAVNKYIRPVWLGSFFGIPQLLLFLAVVKLLGGGIQGFAELSLIPSVQRGFMKFSHDIVHQTFVLLMVPDHPLLKTTVWNFVGFFFGPIFSSGVSLLIMLFFPLLFLYFSLFKPIPEPEAQTGAERRQIKSRLLSGRRRKAIPVVFFIGFILVAWFSQGGESVSRLYTPKARPVVDDQGVIVIPLSDPTMDLMDGALHKFSVTLRDEEIRFIIIKKPDNTLAVCLDACEICPPEGYGQREAHVVCIYCNTPIPVHTLGQPGGCNPIPLKAQVGETSVKIEVREILRKWNYVKTGESREAVQ